MTTKGQGENLDSNANTNQNSRTVKESALLQAPKLSFLSFLIGILVMIFLYLQIILWVGEGSIAEVWRLKKSIASIEQENKVLQERNQKLITEVEALRTGLDLIEHRAREDLGLIKKDEVFYHVIDRRQKDSNAENFSSEKQPTNKNRNTNKRSQ